MMRAAYIALYIITCRDMLTHIGRASNRLINVIFSCLVVVVCLFTDEEVPSQDQQRDILVVAQGGLSWHVCIPAACGVRGADGA